MMSVVLFWKQVTMFSDYEAFSTVIFASNGWITL